MRFTNKGTYVLLIKLSKNKEIKIGSLGKLRFKKGFYAYVGSAMNGLDRRIQRHLRKMKRFYWHIDYLLKDADILKVVYAQTRTKRECDIATYLEQYLRSIKNFGSSDCKCKSHLFFSENFKDLEGDVLSAFSKNRLSYKFIL